MSKSITNLSEFTPKGLLGQMFKRARIFSQLNKQLSERLPETFKSLSLCMIDNNTATFIASNQALAFRAQKQHDILLKTLKQINSLENIEKIVVKVAV